MREPVFTVVLPVYLGARHLSRALQSVDRQTFADWEAVIVDDGGKDDSAAIARAWAAARPGRARVVSHTRGRNLGVAASRNAAVRLARARWVAFLDQDDAWHPRKLERQRAFLRKHPGLAAASCRPRLLYDGVAAQPFIEAWRRSVLAMSRRRAASLGLEDFVRGSPFCLSGTVARRDRLLELGGFDERLRWTSDWLMWALLAARGPLGLQPETLVTYRLHSANEMNELLAEPAGVLRASIEMRALLARALARSPGRSWTRESVDALLEPA